jgi:alpha-beta hydrolase superfamily lysophospholipase
MEVLRNTMTRPLRRLTLCALLVAVGSCTTPWGALRAGGATTTTTTSANPPVKWVDENVSFPAHGITIHATFRHPVGEASPVPGVLLIAGSGPTDRNSNSTLEKGPIDTLKTLADWLSDDGVATLRYDKLGSGKTGLGPYATKVDSIGIAPFEQESAAALTFLAQQKGVNDKQLGVFGHSEGALFALLLATGHAGHVPAIHALGLIEPLSDRYLTLVSVQVEAEVAAQLKAGEISKSLAATVDATLTSAITRLRATGEVSANLKYGLATLLNASNAKFFQEADRFDPKSLARALPSATPVLVTCSTSDNQVSCLQVGRIVQGLRGAGAHYQLIQMANVDHVLKVDPTGSPVNYTKKLPFSPVLRAALKEFVAKNL